MATTFFKTIITVILALTICACSQRKDEGLSLEGTTWRVPESAVVLTFTSPSHHDWLFEFNSDHTVSIYMATSTPTKTSTSPKWSYDGNSLTLDWTDQLDGQISHRQLTTFDADASNWVTERGTTERWVRSTNPTNAIDLYATQRNPGGHFTYWLVCGVALLGVVAYLTHLIQINKWSEVMGSEWKKSILISLSANLRFVFIAAGILFVAGGILGAVFGAVFALCCQAFKPAQPVTGKGLIRNRTKVVLTLAACSLIARMITLQRAIYDLDTTNNLFGSAWILGNSTPMTIVSGIFSLMVALWLGYLAWTAKELHRGGWQWVFGGLALSYLPFVHGMFGVTEIVIDSAVFVFLLVSLFTYRLPNSWQSPKAAPHDGPGVGDSLEAKLRSLERMKDEGLLSEDEYQSQRTRLLK